MTGAPKLGSGFQKSQRERHGRAEARGVKPFDIPPELVPLFHDPIKLGHALGFTGLTDELHGEAYRHLMAQRRGYVELPRSHYKSTLVSIVATIFIKMRDMRARVLHTCATLKLAKDLERSIVERIYADLNVPGYQHLRLVDVFPWLKVKRHNEDEGIFFEGRSGINKEPCITPASVERAIEGAHPTHIITDDLSNRKNSATVDQRAKVIRNYRLLTPIAEDFNCPIWTIGTPWAFTDLSNHLKEIIQVPTMRRSVLDGKPPLGRENEDPPTIYVGEDREERHGWPLDPNILDIDQIQLLCTPGQSEYIGYEEFYANYLCEPTAGEDQMFNLDVWNGTLEPKFSERTRDHDLDIHGLIDVGYEVAMVDPAAKSDGTGCKTGIVIYRVMTAHEAGYPGLPELLNIYMPVEVVEIASGGARLVKELLRLKGDRPKLKMVLCEQQTIIEIIQPWMTKDLGIPFMPLPIGQKSKDARLMGLQLAMMQGRWKRPHSFPGMELLRDYLIRYPVVDSRDVLDAAALVSVLPRKGRARQAQPQEIVEGSIEYFNRLQKGSQMLRGM